MANEVKKVNTIAIADIKNINSQTDDHIKELNAQEFTGFVYSFSGPAWQGTRGLIMGGGQINTGSVSDMIQYNTIPSSANASDFGNMTTARVWTGAGSSGTRAVSMAGANASGTRTTVMDYITTASTADAEDFGDVNLARDGGTQSSDGTRTCLWGGATGNASTGNDINYITIASAADAAVWGDATAWSYRGGSVSHSYRAYGWNLSGGNGTRNDVIQYINIAGSTGDAFDYGDSTTESMDAGQGLEDASRGVLALGNVVSTYYVTAAMDYIATSNSSGSGSDFGDLVQEQKMTMGISDGTNGEFWGGATSGSGGSSDLDMIQKITIDSTGDAADTGDNLVQVADRVGGCSGSQ